MSVFPRLASVVEEEKEEAEEERRGRWRVEMRCAIGRIEKDSRKERKPCECFQGDETKEKEEKEEEGKETIDKEIKKEQGGEEEDFSRLRLFTKSLSSSFLFFSFCQEEND